jgi:hypothetical protein
MAKKKPEIAAKKPPVKLSPRDKKTNESLVGLADRVVDAAHKSRDPVSDARQRPLLAAKADYRDGQREEPAATL